MLTYLTQGHLRLLDTCPRKFQHVYLDHLLPPPSPAQQWGQQWGSQFHLLMQQREMGLPIAPLMEMDAGLKRCFEAVMVADPSLFDSAPLPSGDSFRQSEHRRSLAFNGYLLLGIYDLLLLTPEAGRIIDWKTYLRPQALQALAQDWQTRLYLYLLVETTDLHPQQVKMDYWFVRHTHPDTGEPLPQQITISYSTQQHQQTQGDLQRLTDQLTHLLQTAAPLPQVAVEQGVCATCPFAVRCRRPAAWGNSLETLSLPPIEAIEEVPL